MKYRCMLMDIETQADFFLPDGSCYTPAASHAAKKIYQLFQWVRAHGIPVISTVLRVRPAEHGPMAPHPHCVDGTAGEMKLPRTILPRRVNLGLQNTTDLPGDLFATHQQAIFEKRDTDIFAHMRLERLLTELPATTFILCGAGLARPILQAAVGLRTRNFGVILATDAVVDLDDPMAEMAWKRMEAKGVILAPVAEIVEPCKLKPTRPFRMAGILHHAAPRP